MEVLNEMLTNNDVLNTDGSLKPGVKIIEAETSNIVAEGEVKPINYQKGDPLFLDDSYSGDYCELRNLFLLNKRHDIVQELGKTDRRRIILLREHLLQLAAYNESYAAICMELVFIICRLMVGDSETDLKKPNDDININDIESDDSDDEET